MKSLARSLQRGFTLIEMVVVLLIFAILALLALPVYYSIRSASHAQESPLEAVSQRREAIRAYVAEGLAFAAQARTFVMEVIANGDVKKVTVAYPGTGAPPPGSYMGFEFKPIGATEKIVINPLLMVAKESSPEDSSTRARGSEGTIWIEMDGQKVPKFGLKLTAGFGGLLANGQPREPLLFDAEGNLVDPDGHHGLSDIIWGCSLGDDYSLASHAQYVPPYCRYGATP
ncbi:MAG: prepilin-type N-terminal cleavage/methylation domain-containing protein [Candidatus Accumulibacter sp.]|jgi:prepilin-type N-terminal cleavage/methylation domain-containing protein|nr:prepilin-type N-terminal cleavage/methylation domain-containing protein [Accumulibacter sp.]